jgi:hypothetical protein
MSGRAPAPVISPTTMTPSEPMSSQSVAPHSGQLAIRQVPQTRMSLERSITLENADAMWQLQQQRSSSAGWVFTRQYPTQSMYSTAEPRWRSLAFLRCGKGLSIAMRQGLNPVATNH